MINNQLLIAMINLMPKVVLQCIPDADGLAGCRTN